MKDGLFIKKFRENKIQDTGVSEKMYGDKDFTPVKKIEFDKDELINFLAENLRKEGIDTAKFFYDLGLDVDERISEICREIQADMQYEEMRERGFEGLQEYDCLQEYDYDKD